MGDRERFLARLSAHWPLQIDPDNGELMKRRTPTRPIYGPETNVWEAMNGLLDLIEGLEDRDR